MSGVSTLAVYCGSRHGASAEFRALAETLGARLAAGGITLVYGGGSVGLMGVLADAVLANGGDAIGVIPDFLRRPEIAHSGLTELVVVDSLHARKQRMFDLADAFAVLPGGLGTLDEAVEVTTWKLLALHDKPIYFVDAAYWRPFRDLIAHFAAQGFVAEDVGSLYTVVDTVNDLFAALARAGPPGEAAPPEIL